MKPLMSAPLANNQETRVFLSEGVADLAEHLGNYGRSVLWVFDSNTVKLFKQVPHSHIVLQAGESSKTFVSLERIIAAALEEGLSRDGRIIAFGGGMVCDIASLAASVYMRGIALTLVPTSLLAMVDAAFGGKTSIDYRGVKNVVGTFYPAQEILITIDLLRSLSEREYNSGLAEVIRTALLSGDEALYRHLVVKKRQILSRDTEAIAEMIRLSLTTKKHYVVEDPEDQKGVRKMLNFGHTFAHALESTFHFGQFSHGEAVAWGCCRALEAGIQLGVTDPRWGSGAIKLFRSYGYDIDYRIGRGDWIAFHSHLMKDKKRVDGELHFVLVSGQGKPMLQTVDLVVVQQLVITAPLV